ncbi:hypothetical protein Tco_1518060 [Tanacetum coccineum]
MISAGSDQGKKKRRKGIDDEPSKKSFASKESSKVKTLPKTSKTSKSLIAKEPVEEHVHEMAMDVKEPTLNDTVDDVNQPQADALTNQLDWASPEGERCPYDLSKTLPLKGRLGHLTIPVDHFFNNDLEFLRTGNTEQKYTTLITRTKAASVVNVKVDKQFGYGNLEEIVVRRANQKLYTFKEGDFKNLHLNDIEDMLILRVKNKLSNLKCHDIID